MSGAEKKKTQATHHYAGILYKIGLRGKLYFFSDVRQEWVLSNREDPREVINSACRVGEKKGESYR